jgi:hypothetical protein
VPLGDQRVPSLASILTSMPTPRVCRTGVAVWITMRIVLVL